MADIQPTPVLDYGTMLQSYSTAEANQNLTNAQTQQVGAQTQGTQLANQKTALQLGLIKQAMLAAKAPAVNDSTPQAVQAGDASGVAPTSGSGGGDGTEQSAAEALGLDHAHVAKTAQQHFAVKDIWAPQELQALQQAILWKQAGMPDTTQDIISQHKARIDTAANKAQLQASDFYDQSYAVATAPEGAALATLRAIHGDMAGAIENIATKKGWTPEQTDKFVRDYANEAGNASHRYSGRDVEIGTDGIARDKQTNQPILGGNPAGLSASAYADLSKAGSAITTVTRGGKETQMPQWQADGAKSLAQWVNQQAHQGQAPAGSEAAPAAPAPTASGVPSRVKAAVTGLPPDKAAFVASGPDAPPFLNTGNSKPNPGDTEAQQSYMKQRSAQLKMAGEEQQTAQTTLVNASRASAALAKATTLGPGSGGWAEIQTIIRNWTGQQAADAIENNAAMRQLLGKELGQDQLNTILSKLHGEGAQVRLGAQESSLILNHLSANPELSRNAITQMLTWEKSDAQYALDKAKARRAWVNAGKDLEQFDAAYEDKFPRSTRVQTNLGEAPAPAAAPAGGAQKFSALPPAAQYSGKVVREIGADGKPTGRRLKSDGVKWNVLPGAQ